jgi:hypothetical protein
MQVDIRIYETFFVTVNVIAIKKSVLKTEYHIFAPIIKMSSICS